MKNGGEVESLEEPKGKLWSTGRRINAVLAVVGFCITVWMVYMMISDPFFGPRGMHLFFMMVSAAVFVNMSITIPLSYFSFPKGLRFFAGVGKWILTIVFPFFLMAFINSFADDRTVDIAKAELLPVINFLDKEFNQHGKFPADILEEVKKIGGLTNVTYVFNEEHFVIQTSGSSVDIDGSIIFYMSSDKEWRREHNDIIEAVATEEAKRYRKAIKWNPTRIYRVNSKTNQWEPSGP